jgi:signal recognition particle GTPase
MYRERQIMQTVKDLSVEELKTLIAEVVEEKFREMLVDPDLGLTLRPEVRERLRSDLEEPQQEEGNIPAAEVARRRGLEW